MTTPTNSEALPPTTGSPSLDCEGYRKILIGVEKDESSGHKNWHDYGGKLAWIVARANHYAEKTGLTPEAILDAWEAKRDYWYMNYYQESRQPLINDDKVRVFETVADMLESMGKTGFRCPACEGVSKSPYECTTGIEKHGKPCDWKVYGLFGHMGKGVSVFVKEKVAGESLFMPVAWESSSPENVSRVGPPTEISTNQSDV